jgi:hypothetical protein
MGRFEILTPPVSAVITRHLYDDPTYRELRGSDSWQLSSICRLLTEGSSKLIFRGELVRHAKQPFATTLDQLRQRTCDLESCLDALQQIKPLRLFS